MSMTAAPAAPALPCLSAVSVDLMRGTRALLQGFDLTLRPGECVWLAGPNGSGKSSLLHALCGLVPIEEGEIRWFGRTLTEADRAGWHYLAHTDALKAELTVRENVHFQAALCGAPVSPQALQPVLEALHLEALADSPVEQLSQGQKRKAALMHLRLLPARPVWLLDEPFNALDSEARDTLSHWMNSHRARGGALLFTHHFALPPLLQVDRTVTLGEPA